MAGLAAAFDLTRTKALQDKFDVTIYQMGWRLGGKAASGRDCDGRIVEHGLHVWFGCYENAFELVRAAYNDWVPQEGQAILSPDDAFQAQARTAMGSGDRAEFFGLYWPRVAGLPGLGDAPPLLWPCITQLLFVIESQYRTLAAQLTHEPSGLPIPPDIAVLMAQAQAPMDPLKWSKERTQAGELPFTTCLSCSRQWAESLGKEAQLRDETHLRGFVRYLRMLSRHHLGDRNFRSQPKGEFLAELQDVGTALVTGVILDMVLGGASVVELDRLDFREWLSANGAERNSVYGSSIVHSIYDTAFQYCQGDTRRPSFGAGTAAQVSMRLLGSYKGAFAYESRAGLGELVIAPIFQALRKRKVRFQFFHKLTGLELSKDRDTVARIHFDRQVDLLSASYEPTIPPRPEFGNLECWPQTPCWSQIKDGDKLRGIDLESHWCDQKVGQATLSRGVEFDEAVLAIPIGAFKPLNEDAGPCAELIRASDRFKKMTDAASLVPTISVQVWCTETLAQMGWPLKELGLQRGTLADFPTSTGPRPLNIWADRSPVLKFENWDRVKVRPVTLHYLCDVLETSSHSVTSNRLEVPNIAARKARELAVDWFKTKSRVVWPRSNRDKTFNWDLLFDREGRKGEDRIDDQVVKANVDPWACCAGSPAGSTQWRLRADRSGFGHLFLAGAWTDTGFNTECIEAAVISGKQAARAITGSDARIVGEDFLHFDRGLGALVKVLLNGAGALAEGVLSPVLEGSGRELARRASRTRRQVLRRRR